MQNINNYAKESTLSMALSISANSYLGILTLNGSTVNKFYTQSPVSFVFQKRKLPEIVKIENDILNLKLVV